MRITRLTVDGLASGCITDEAPRIGFALASDTAGEALASAVVRIGEWETTTTEQAAIAYDGPLTPFTDYPVHVTATGTTGAVATAETTFRTGRLDRTGRSAPTGRSAWPSGTTARPTTPP